jgi:hypothetical protein
LFGTLDEAVSLHTLRDLCQRLGYCRMTWHALRRGMANDMLRSGRPLAQVLVAGGWKSSAFLAYVKRRHLSSRVDHETRLVSDSE